MLLLLWWWGVVAVVVMRDRLRPSQLVMVHIGLRNAQSLGWVRDLSRAQQKALKLQVHPIIDTAWLT